MDAALPRLRVLETEQMSAQLVGSRLQLPRLTRLDVHCGVGGARWAGPPWPCRAGLWPAGGSGAALLRRRGRAYACLRLAPLACAEGARLQLCAALAACRVRSPGPHAQTGSALLMPASCLMPAGKQR